MRAPVTAERRETVIVNSAVMAGFSGVDDDAAKMAAAYGEDTMKMIAHGGFDGSSIRLYARIAFRLAAVAVAIGEPFGPIQAIPHVPGIMPEYPASERRPFVLESAPLYCGVGRPLRVQIRPGGRQ